MTAIPDELIIEGAARAFAALLDRGDLGERLVSRLAELRAELLTTAEAAELLRCSPKTLRANHAEWGIAKSVALGVDEPRFYRSQIMERMRALEIKGRDAANVTHFPKRPAA